MSTGLSILLALMLMLCADPGRTPAQDMPTSSDAHSLPAASSNSQTTDRKAEAERTGDSSGDDEVLSLLELSIEDLSEIPIARHELTMSATLAPVLMPDSQLDTPPVQYGWIVPRTTPGAVTRINEQLLWNTSARSHNELFDILVPNFQFMRHNNKGFVSGFRGIISDLDDKLLYKVNDRVLNHHSSFGAFSERDLPLFGDIRYIDVLRGPGSAVDGPGAISGMINVRTHDGLSFSGLDTRYREGFLEEFSAAEARVGHQWNDQTGFFLYYGVADYRGADADNSPFFFSRSFTARDNIPVMAGEAAEIPIAADHRSHQSTAKHKAYAHFTHKNFNLWARYTRGGEQVGPKLSKVAKKPIGKAGKKAKFTKLRTAEAGYQQLTFTSTLDLEPLDDFDLRWLVSYDIFDFSQQGPNANSQPSANREDELLTRLLGKWRVADRHLLAIAFEWSYEQFGLPSLGLSGTSPKVGKLPRGRENLWTTDTYSVVGEYQWQLNNAWLLFLDGRLDKHTYTDWLVSPRAAVVYMPNDRDTFKLSATNSVRRPPDNVMRHDFLATNNPSDAETNAAVELRYECRPSEPYWFAVSAFYQDNNAVSFSPSLKKHAVLGEFTMAGFEAEANIHIEKTRIIFSHGYVQLINSLLDDPTIIQGISAEPYGFGQDLAGWSNHITKIYVERRLNDTWTVNSSLRVYWGFPGDEALTQFNSGQAKPSFSLGIADPDFDEAFEGNYYLNLGVGYKPTEHLTLRADLYNILGWIDPVLTKRNVLRRAEYRTEAPSVSISARLTY